MTDQNLAVIVLAAGQGTRMRSARPKVLHPLAGIPIVGHVLATARELAPAHVIVVVRHERDAVAEAVLELLPEAILVDQDETPGTGRAVEQAIAALPAGFAGDVVIVSGDVPLLDAATLAGLIAAHREGARGRDAPLRHLRRRDRLRQDRARRRRHGGPHRRTAGRDRGRARDPRGELGNLRLSPRAVARPARPRRDPQRPGRDVPHGRHRTLARRRVDGRRDSRARELDRRGNQRPRAARRVRARAQRASSSAAGSSPA